MAKHTRFRDEHLQRLRDRGYAKQYFELALKDYFDGISPKEELLAAIRSIVEACGGVGIISKATGVHRDTIYKTLSDGNPSIETLHDIMGFLNDDDQVAA